MSQTKVTDALRDVTAVDGAKITTGTIPEARITSLDATKLTGNIANARIPASAVTQHVTGFDDSSIRADILKLALSQAVDGNRVAYSLEDSFIDGFEDDSGITTETTVSRDTTGEYVSSRASASSFSTIWGPLSGGASQGNGFNNYLFRNIISSVSAGEWNPIRITTTSGISSTGSIDNASIGIRTGSDFDTTTTPTEVLWGGTSGSTGADQVSDELNFTLNGGTEYIFIVDMDNTYYTYKFTGGIPSNSKGSYKSSTNAYGYDVADAVDGATKQSYCHFIKQIEGKLITTNATGTLISDPQTASTSRTSASGVIIYEDGAGTNTLGADLKIYFSCDNSAWTEASSYGTATTYSGTKKLVKLGATTCTAGTSIAMKAVWANQSASSTAIPQNTGSIIGDFTSNAANAFNDTSGTRAEGAERSSSVNSYIGKDLGSGNEKKITGASWECASNGDSVGSASSITFYLYVSNSAPSSYNNGTLLGTIGTEANGVTGIVTSKLDFSNTTAYRYVWIHGQINGGGVVTYCTEARFYASDGVTGKEARLHGWAVNY